MEEVADKVTEPMLEMFERAKCVHKRKTESQEKSCKSLDDNEMQPDVDGGGYRALPQFVLQTKSHP